MQTFTQDETETKKGGKLVIAHNLAMCIRDDYTKSTLSASYLTKYFTYETLKKIRAAQLSGAEVEIK